MQELGLFIDIGIILIASTILAGIARLFKQPTITAYIVAGIVIGPFGLRLVADQDVISTLSEMGIALLLFIVGLEIDVEKLKRIRMSAAFAGIGQVLAMFLIGLAVLSMLGFGKLEAVYVSIALALSSTMVVVKLLSDMHELDTLHGRISLGILIVQDVIAILALAVLGNSGFASGTVIISLAKGAGLFCIAIVCNKFLLPPLLRSIAKSPELLFLTAISWCFAFALIANQLGYSIAIGAFLAGVSFAYFPFNIEIAGRIQSLRDFFTIIFFTALGMQLALPYLNIILSSALLLSFFVLFATIPVVFFIVKMLKYGNKTAFLSAVAVAQISEFSLILMMEGQKTGAIHPTTASMVTLIAIITIALSANMITHGDKLYRLLQHPLAFFGKRFEEDLTSIPKKMRGHAIIFGCHRIGIQLVDALKHEKRSVIVVDFNPDVISRMMKEKIPCVYGDLGDPEIFDRVNATEARLIVSTVPDDYDNRLLLEKAKNKDNTVIVTARHPDEALALYKQGADYVIIPRIIAGDFMRHALQKLDAVQMKKLKQRHIKDMQDWKKCPC
ncbi:cation:proton antiporter [Candidatus Micrarchaeota archaeon]|nr:cation:proton antiporter [Candidatus Micrarchaeota archaeon]